MYFKLGGFKIFTYFFVIWRPCLPYKNSDFAMLARKDSSPSCGPPMNGSTSQVPIPTASAGLYSQWLKEIQLEAHADMNEDLVGTIPGI